MVLDIRFINIRLDTLTFTDVILVEQILRNVRSCFKVLEYRILYRTNIKDAPTFNVFKRLIKPFLRVRKDTSSISDYLHIYICSENILISYSTRLFFLIFYMTLVFKMPVRGNLHFL